MNVSAYWIIHKQNTNLKSSFIYIIHDVSSLQAKRRELNKVILRAVSYIVLLRCRLIYNQQYAPYEHLYIYSYIYINKWKPLGVVQSTLRQQAAFVRYRLYRQVRLR